MERRGGFSSAYMHRKLGGVIGDLIKTFKGIEWGCYLVYIAYYCQFFLLFLLHILIHRLCLSSGIGWLGERTGGYLLFATLIPSSFVLAFIKKFPHCQIGICRAYLLLYQYFPSLFFSFLYQHPAYLSISPFHLIYSFYGPFLSFYSLNFS